MQRSIKNASRILKEAFCGWIASIVIERQETSYHFGENCLFINFNYTDTLLKRFQIDPMDEFHIHGGLPVQQHIYSRSVGLHS